MENPECPANDSGGYAAVVAHGNSLWDLASTLDASCKRSQRVPEVPEMIGLRDLAVLILFSGSSADMLIATECCV